MLRSLCVLACVLQALDPKADRPAAKADDVPAVVLEGHQAAVGALAFVDDGRRIAAADGRDVRTWDAATGRMVAVLEGKGDWTVAFSADGKRMASAGRDGVTVRDTAAGEVLREIDPHRPAKGRPSAFRPRVAAMAFSPDGLLLATAASSREIGGPHGLPGGVVAVWEVESGREVHRFGGLSTAAGAVAFAADGRSLVAGTGGAGGELPEPGEVWVWDLGGRAPRSFKVEEEVEQGDYVSAAEVAFSPDGRRVAVAVGAGGRGRPAGLLIEDQPAAVQVWDLASGRRSLDIRGPKTWVGRVAFSPDGRHVAAAGGDRVVRLWDATNGALLLSLDFDADRIDAVAFSPDGSRLAVGGGLRRAGLIKVWMLRGN